MTKLPSLAVCKDSTLSVFASSFEIRSSRNSLGLNRFGHYSLLRTQGSDSNGISSTVLGIYQRRKVRYLMISYIFFLLLADSKQDHISESPSAGPSRKSRPRGRRAASGQAAGSRADLNEDEDDDVIVLLPAASVITSNR
jgi:hypothetical protein